MRVTSPAFKNKEKIPEKHTADGENVNPELLISDIHPNAKTLVLICDDPDAKRVVGYTWVHWVVFNIPVPIPKREIKIKENLIPGTPGESTYKKPEYLGPSPPKGTGVHHYYFKVYSLDTELALPKMASLKSVEEAMKGHVLECYEFIGEYWRD